MLPVCVYKWNFLLPSGQNKLNIFYYNSLFYAGTGNSTTVYTFKRFSSPS